MDSRESGNNDIRLADEIHGVANWVSHPTQGNFHGKTAMGLVNTPYCIMDEPGSYETVGGQLMFDAIQTAQGKPFSPLKAIYIGTLAPAVRRLVA